MGVVSSLGFGSVTLSVVARVQRSMETGSSAPSWLMTTTFRCTRITRNRPMDVGRIFDMMTCSSHSCAVFASCFGRSRNTESPSLKRFVWQTFFCRSNEVRRPEQGRNGRQVCRKCGEGGLEIDYEWQRRTEVRVYRIRFPLRFFRVSCWVGAGE